MDGFFSLNFVQPGLFAHLQTQRNHALGCLDDSLISQIAGGEFVPATLCHKLVSIQDFPSRLLLPAAAALSPKLVSLHSMIGCICHLLSRTPSTQNLVTAAIAFCPFCCIGIDPVDSPILWEIPSGVRLQRSVGASGIQFRKENC